MDNVGICKTCGAEHPLMKNGMCGRCMRSLPAVNAGDVGKTHAQTIAIHETIGTREPFTRNDAKDLTDKIETLTDKLDDVITDVRTVKFNFNKSTKDEDNDNEVTSVPAGRDDADDDMDDDENAKSGGFGSLAGCILIIGLIMVTLLVLFPGVIRERIFGKH